MPFGMSLATGPVGKPAIYDPLKPPGQRWSNNGFDTSSIARLYHSSALLLPDGSVMIAGSNPNVDYNGSTVYSTEYRAEYFYPPYFSASTRPQPSGIPTTLTYGGDYFNITVPSSSYSGDANDAATNTTVSIIRPGWTTHGINMGQRAMQLNSTVTVGSDGTLTFHVAPPPPNPNLFQPGPALFFVTIHGIPSIGKMLIVGSGEIETQPTLPPTELPQSLFSSVNAAGSADPSTSTGPSPNDKKSSAAPSRGIISASIAAGAALLASVFVL